MISPAWLVAETVELTTPVTIRDDPLAPRISVLDGIGAKVIGIFPWSIFEGKMDTCAPESATAPMTLISKGPEREGIVTVIGRRGWLASPDATATMAVATL